MKTDPIEISASSHTYPVYVGTGLLKHLKKLIGQAGATDQHFVVSSPPVWRLHGSAVKKSLPKTEHLLIPDGERSKTVQSVSRIYEALIRTMADRSVTIIAVGGGVIGDVVGFAAATYLRGVQLVHVPTTLLAQVDSSIGGKVGVNHQLGKNLIGSFHQPIAVVSDPDVLNTLPRREFRSGLYEIIKYGMIADQELFDRVRTNLSGIFNRSPETIEPIITTSCQIKAAVVEKDEQEHGLRRILNFGHTAGHAIEAATNYRRFRHGEAIAYGMLAVANIATKRGMLSENDRTSLTEVIENLGPLPSVRDLSAKKLLEIMKRDKKVSKGHLHVVLPTGIGTTEIVSDVTTREWQRALKLIGVGL